MKLRVIEAAAKMDTTGWSNSAVTIRKIKPPVIVWYKYTDDPAKARQEVKKAFMEAVGQELFEIPTGTTFEITNVWTQWYSQKEGFIS